ncbi:glycoside hydrolase family 73 protein [Floricoccus penangensis]|uniref:glycoside hydrolase family 73 protein n=1 Tax=Floricoccus penangensis TaxID=1859475 RepID=UPI002040FEE1|nr:glycoside hydrolase family 73 protein [Floricoccus penangensis]URZ87954.1 glycoside hydrolase family 73 protein [Floricoccus penangensis]
MRRKLKIPFLILLIIMISLILFLINKVSIEYKSEDISSGVVRKNKVSKEEFIKDIAPAAQNVQRSYGIRASLIMAQAILESNFGQSDLASKYNNLFGVKAGTTDKHIKLETKEYIDGKWITIKDDFAWYDSWSDSIIAHAKLMREGVDWDKNLYEDVIAADNYKDAAKSIEDAGYATDPTYADKLIEVIEQYKLYEYDRQ